MDANDWNRRYESAEHLWSVTPNQFVEQELSDVSVGRALDMASGEGRNAIWLAQRGWEVDAVDFSQVALDRARRMAEENRVQVNWIDSDLLSWVPERRAYELALISYLHLPWPKMLKILHSAIHSLVPGGLFLLIGHDRDNLEHGYGGPSDPAVLCSPEEIAGELEGFIIEKAFQVERLVDSDQPNLIAIDHIIRAVRKKI